MVVDDDPGVRQVVVHLFRDDYDIQQAADGQEALELMLELRPDLLLLDIRMPRMDGLAVLKAAKSILPALRVLMLTANTDIGIARDALDIGARAYITKPFTLEDLRNEVIRLLEPPDRDEYRPWRIVSPPDS